MSGKTLKNAVIIGATSGIGHAIATQLAESGVKVAITVRRADLLEKLAAKNPENFVPVIMDVTNIHETLFSLERMAESLSKVDLILISSGWGDLNENLDFEIEKKTIDVNVSGFTAICDWAFNYFEKQGFGQLSGITSVAGLRGSRFSPSYSATKAYQINYLEGLRQKSAKSKAKITITDIRPGFVDTAMAKGEGQFWKCTPEKAATKIISALSKEKGVAYITKRWCSIGFILKILPRFLYNKM